MEADYLKEEKIRNLFSECLKLKLEIVKLFLTFTSISIGIIVFIESNPSFDNFFGFNLRLWGGIVGIGFIVWVGLYLNSKMYEVNHRYFGI